MNRQILVALGSGVVFGLGLAVSQMINPAKVLGFLDVAGAWDPSLAFVMAGALLVMGIAWRIQARRVVVAVQPGLPPAPERGIDRPLVAGALVFGAGWGLVGYCPGPAIASLALLSAEPVLFVLAMLAGMQLYRFWDRWQARRPGSSAREAEARAS
ncbi:MAG: DUF6691 family protein [Gammaproteobacteria bacterium]